MKCAKRRRKRKASLQTKRRPRKATDIQERVASNTSKVTQSLLIDQLSEIPRCGRSKCGRMQKGANECKGAQTQVRERMQKKARRRFRLQSQTTRFWNISTTTLFGLHGSTFSVHSHILLLWEPLAQRIGRIAVVVTRGVLGIITAPIITAKVFFEHQTNHASCNEMHPMENPLPSAVETIKAFSVLVDTLAVII